ncbi:hypothetical protein JF66_02850 [Cryobacterium sp. MLB-32]|nr:hypothetical protein JF66_02850 [Cryobacterium sp. MLB-32]
MSSANDPAPRAPDAQVPPRSQARYRGILAAAGAALLTACLLLVPLNGAQDSGWTVLGTIALGLLLTSTALYAGSAAPGSRGGPTLGAPHPSGRRRLALRLAGVAAATGLVLVLGMVTARLFVPAPEQTVTVQFSDPTGRVILEYCPTLPGSFEAQARPADLSGGSSTLPIRVTADICGNPEFDKGIWLYLQRSGITIGVADR